MMKPGRRDEEPSMRLDNFIQRKQGKLCARSGNLEKLVNLKHALVKDHKLCV